MTLSGTLVFFANWVKACHIGSPDWWVCCFEIDVSGCTWAMTPVLGDPNVTAFLSCPCTGSVQLVLQRAASYTWPKIHLRWRHMSHHSRPILQRTGMRSLIRYRADVTLLSSDMAQMSHFCWQWQLKPSTSKTVCSVFHLHNTSATHCQFIWMASALGMSATQPILGWL